MSQLILNQMKNKYSINGDIQAGLEFARRFSDVQEAVHRMAKEKGWWDRPEILEKAVTALHQSQALNPIELAHLAALGDRNTGEALALMHSEISEALEVFRKDPGLKDAKCPDHLAVEVELADCIIRIMDFAGANGLDIAGAICAKVNFNATRPHRHGKKF